MFQLLQFLFSAQSYMYPYGLDNGDSEFRLGDSYYYYYGHCLELKVDGFGFPFFNKRHYKLHVRMIPWYVNSTKEVLKIPHLVLEHSSSCGPLWYLLFCLVFSIELRVKHFV